MSHLVFDLNLMQMQTKFTFLPRFGTPMEFVRFTFLPRFGTPMSHLVFNLNLMQMQTKFTFLPCFGTPMSHLIFNVNLMQMQTKLLFDLNLMWMWTKLRKAQEDGLLQGTSVPWILSADLEGFCCGGVIVPFDFCRRSDSCRRS